MWGFRPLPPERTNPFRLRSFLLESFLSSLDRLQCRLYALDSRLKWKNMSMSHEHVQSHPGFHFQLYISHLFQVQDIFISIADHRETSASYYWYVIKSYHYFNFKCSSHLVSVCSAITEIMGHLHCRTSELQSKDGEDGCPFTSTIC